MVFGHWHADLVQEPSGKFRRWPRRTLPILTDTKGLLFVKPRVVDSYHDPAHVSLISVALYAVNVAGMALARLLSVCVPRDESARKRFVSEAEFSAVFIDGFRAAFETNVIPVANVRLNRGSADRSRSCYHCA